uniref:5-hydroxytryptamine receptor 3A-like n=1 Tax=Scophthalmus maximus TaxID=52904 RepID=A0A8D3DXI4_SCOMX
MLNCSQPDAPSLLEALKPVFNLKSIRPVMNVSTPTTVNIFIILFGILGVDWRNEFILWDPEQCGSQWITIPRKLLWVPDVVINEFMEKNSAPFAPYNYVYFNGSVVDAQPVRVISSCRLDIYLFPFDVQNCSLSFNSYLYQYELQIDLLSSAEDMFDFSKEVMATMGEWELIGITVKKFDLTGQDEETYQEIRFYISLRRRATLYVVNLLVPSCSLITVDLFSFLLPPQTTDRSSFKMTLILGYTVFLLIMNDLLPITGDTIPLMNVFLSLCLALMVASLLETILITNLLRGSAHSSPVPHWIRGFVLHVLGRLAPEQNGPLNETKALEELRSLGKELQALRLQVEQQQLGGNQSAEEWVQVGLIIDRLLCGIYILFISVSFITIIAIWAQSYNTV